MQHKLTWSPLIVKLCCIIEGGKWSIYAQTEYNGDPWMETLAAFMQGVQPPPTILDRSSDKTLNDYHNNRTHNL